jgi:DNA-3-methyladenine glycosylase II
MQLSYLIPLPRNFRLHDTLEFHRRDVQQVSEQVTDTTLCKGMVWQDMPVRLFIQFSPEYAEATLTIDDATIQINPNQFKDMVYRMLGLDQCIEIFEHQYRSHPQLGPLIRQQPGLRVPLAATPFEALTWAITGQQISVSAAVSIRRKLISATNIRHTSGLLCYPQARQILQLTEPTLRQAGFSTSKAKTLLAVSAQVLDGQLPLDAWVQTRPIETICAQLQTIRGIGPWTVNYALLRGYGWLDGSLHGDAAVRRGLQSLLNQAEKLSEDEAKTWLAQFTPWRALISAHIWARQSLPATLSP